MVSKSAWFCLMFVLTNAVSPEFKRSQTQHGSQTSVGRHRSFDNVGRSSSGSSANRNHDASINSGPATRSNLRTASSSGLNTQNPVETTERRSRYNKKGVNDRTSVGSRSGLNTKREGETSALRNKKHNTGEERTNTGRRNGSILNLNILNAGQKKEGVNRKQSTEGDLTNTRRGESSLNFNNQNTGETTGLGNRKHRIGGITGDIGSLARHADDTLTNTRSVTESRSRGGGCKNECQGGCRIGYICINRGCDRICQADTGLGGKESDASKIQSKRW